MSHPRPAATATSAFGVSKREGHDAAEFYRRFADEPLPPPLDPDFQPLPVFPCNHIWAGDARRMDEGVAEDPDGPELPDNSVALVVTSPPYFVGKEYETDVNDPAIPATYSAYLQMLTEVFTQCYRKLEPGGRIAVNVANLGRKPYRSLSSVVMQLLTEVGYVLQAELIWRKAQSQAGSCAWGSFQSPASPVIRDLTERIVVASKGSGGRVMSAAARAQRGLPAFPSLERDAFMSSTLDVWEFPPAHATRVGHPAPYPVELPRRLIDLYTWQDDLVLDPFMGAGTTAVAAVERGRRYAGFELDPQYVDLARRRAAASEVTLPPAAAPPDLPGTRVEEAAADAAGVEAWYRQARRDGLGARSLMLALLTQCGFTIEKRGYTLEGAGVTVDAFARDVAGQPYYFGFCGDYSGTRPGLCHLPTLWQAIAIGGVLYQVEQKHRMAQAPYCVLTTDLPSARTAAGKALANVSGPARPLHDIIWVDADRDLHRLWSLGQADRDAAELLRGQGVQIPPPVHNNGFNQDPLF